MGYHVQDLRFELSQLVNSGKLPPNVKAMMLYERVERLAARVQSAYMS